MVMQEPSMLRLCLSQIVGGINHACFKDKKKCLGGSFLKGKQVFILSTVRIFLMFLNIQ